MLDHIRRTTFGILAAALTLFVLFEVNYPRLTPQGNLAIFALLGSVLVFLKYPAHPRFAKSTAFQLLDFVLMIAVVICFGFVLLQSEPAFSDWWLAGRSLGERAGMEQSADYLMGLLGVILVLEATRRAIGLSLPLLSLLFLIYAAIGPYLPDWLFPHRGYDWQRIVSQTFLHSQGVFGIALNVMFTYVFLFVLFGTVLEKTGATAYIINFARHLFRNSVGGPAKVAVVSSGMMGSLSGSAVANVATTGTFTIPMMKSYGFLPHTAAGIEAAASSGGALMPPIMGAGAYMMLEIIEPPVTYLQVIKAAIIPAILYYAALLFIVHFRAKFVGAMGWKKEVSAGDTPPEKMRGVIFFAAIGTLIIFLALGYTPFRAVTLSLIAILLLSVWKKETRITLRGMYTAMTEAAHGGVPLIVAASCVGIVLGVVTLTGVGSRLPAVLLALAQNNVIFALILIMISTIILGMGLPSAVCYLLMATLIGPILGDLGLIPLAAHLFIFYFGMMSMVTPPVALAGYTAAAIAGAGIMQSSFAAFRFSLVGFALPFAFVLRPELLLLSADGGTAGVMAVILNLLLTLVGIIPLAASVTNYFFAPLKMWERAVLMVCAFCFLLTRSDGAHLAVQLPALIGVVAISLLNWRERSQRLSVLAREF
jgi:TRAP transporter 4TM/12TM fusion protein